MQHKPLIIKDNFIIILIAVNLLLGVSCSKKIYNQSVRSSNFERTRYKVEKIAEQETVYVIELLKNDSIYTVLTKSKINPKQISPLHKNIDECKTEMIEVGKSYDLELDIFYQNILEKDYIGSLDIQHFVEYNGTQITIKTGQTLYSTKNLKGLCLIK